MLDYLLLAPEDTAKFKTQVAKQFLSGSHTLIEFGYFFDWLSDELAVDDDDFIEEWSTSGTREFKTRLLSLSILQYSESLRTTT
ncbi:MAG TPA: hypothetical protein DDZ60_03845 [Planktothrix sp. UBA10369]|jgi:hypothetical protein|nr:hypothetical protein [Microcoleaceae cyanobacterium UBA11344]HBK21654.1 hypothetical protein [Planktothrix sp. UBA10369]